MIPSPIQISGCPWDVLPPGVHWATVSEIEVAFSTNRRRKTLFEGLRAALEQLKVAGCRIVYLDGSYVTAKPKPGDYDACWDPSGVDPSALDPVFLSFENKRAAQKKKYLGEFFPFAATAAPGFTYLGFFQTDRFTGNAKGIVAIDLCKESFGQ